MSVADHLLFRTARVMTRLPPGVQRALSGGRAIERGPYTLDPGIQLILATDPNAKKPWPEDALVLRRTQDRAIIAARGPLPAVRSTRDLEVDGAAGTLAARLYSARDKTAPLLVYFHGGGFVFGDIETHEVGCRLLCANGNFHVLSVEYRLVPEHRFPAPIDDAIAALGWAFAHASELGADPSRIGVGGDSAGGNLSAVVSQLTRGTKLAPACQLLIYPATDRARAHPSMNELAQGFLLTRASVEWFHAQYAAAVGADSRDPRISPLLATDLGGLPPALVVTAGFDPLRDEGEAYAAALSAAGTTAVLQRCEGLIHGFFNLTGIHDVSRDAVIAIAGATRAMFEVRGASDVRAVTGNGAHAHQLS
jgi:acetyl esterase